MKKTICLAVSLSLLVLAGCSKDKGEAHSQTSQVLAKVNNTEITVHQLNFALSKLGKLDESQYKQASATILKQLVDMELLKQKAVEANLDRNSNVMQTVEASKNQILAQAYVQKIASKQAAPAEYEVNNFYNEHPELFGDRQVYVITEFVVKNTDNRMADIQAGIDPAKSPDEIAAWLKQNNFEFAANVAKKSAEQLPLELAKQLAGLKVGDTLAIDNRGSAVLLFVSKIDKQPIDAEKAKPAIKQFLVNSAQQKLIKSELANIHKTAKVEFYGDFKELTLAGSEASNPVGMPATAAPNTEGAVENK